MSRFELERKISDLVKKDNGCSAHFVWNVIFDSVNDYTYCKGAGRLQLELITLNPVHGTSFLMHKIEYYTGEPINNNHYIYILNKVIEVLGKKEKHLASYMVQWSQGPQETSAKTITSYFYANSMKELLEKFYYEKNQKNAIIYKIELMAES